MLDNMGDEWDSSFEDEHDYEDEFWDNEEMSEQDEELPNFKPNPMDEEDETIYEIWDDEDMDDEDMDMDDEDMDMDDEDMDMEMDEEESEGGQIPNQMSESSFKPKGRVGKMKFKYPSKMKKGVAETAFEETDEEWEKEMSEELVSPEDGDETPEKSEASRTLGNGRKWGRKGLPKPRTAPRHLNVESVQSEVKILREKNEEYKKALDFFRNKLNEVAVFNSNLAYSTRLFTEHSTTKQEKINVLRRFDNVDTLKESKNLYRTIKNELEGKGSTSVVKESITEKVVKTPQTGSATNLIESKTYENPQFLRMKDLMTKIK
jgi:hypothetical protein